MYEPNSSLFIGRVPWNSTYEHVRLYSNATEQYNEISGWCNIGFRRDDYTYQRLDNAIVVPYNAELLYGTNYVMYQNADYGSKWFYAFIESIEYVNPESTRLTLSTDIFQTWWFSVSLGGCMVEREHVNDDGIGVHIRNENISPGVMVSQGGGIEINEDDEWAIMVAALADVTGEGYVNTPSAKYGYTYSGARYSVMADYAGHNALSDLTSLMTGLSSNGQQGTVCDVWMIPQWMIEWGGTSRIEDKSDGFGFWLKEGEISKSAEYTINISFDMSNIQGYVPKNNKLYTYPFCKLVAVTPVSQQEYMIENFPGIYGSEPGELNFTFHELLDWQPGSSPYYFPDGYNNVAFPYEFGFSGAPVPSCTWAYESFQNLYTGGMGLKLNAAYNNAAANFGAANYSNYANLKATEITATNTQVVGAVNALATANPATSTANLASGLTTGLARYETGKVHYRADENKIKVNLQNRLRELNAELGALTLTPNTLKGSLSNSNSILNSGLFRLSFRIVTPREEVVRIIDNFFSLYGYAIGVIKYPNFTGRLSWNYVKTKNANCTGDIPEWALRVLNAILDGGTTFWHTSDVGNYSLDNYIV